MRTVRIVRSLLLNVGAVLGAIGIVGVGLSFIFGVSFLSVVSGSMEPSIPTGSMVFTKQAEIADLRPGDIITIPRNSAPGSTIEGSVTHRIVSIEPEGDGQRATVVLRGDANPSDDPAPYVITSAKKYFFHVPALGSLSLLLQTPLGISIVVLAAALLVFVFFLPTGRENTNAATEADSTEADSTDAENTDAENTETGSGETAAETHSREPALSTHSFTTETRQQS